MLHSILPSIHHDILRKNNASLACGLLFLLGCDTGRLLAVADETIPNASGGTHPSSSTHPSGGATNATKSTGGSSTGGSSTGGSSTGGSSTGGSSIGDTDIPNCGQVGTACFYGSDCCSGACTNTGIPDTNGEDLLRCQGISGCRPAGEICHSATECCSGICKSNGTVQVCGFSALNCHSRGEVCGPNDSTKLECCDDIQQNHRSCNPSLAGVFQCHNTFPNQEPAPDGAPCRTALDCRSWFCMPSNDGTTVCSPICNSVGQACRASSDCCIFGGPIACINELCQTVSTTCRQLGQPCAVPSDCCDGNCKLFNGAGFCVTVQ